MSTANEPIVHDGTLCIAEGGAVFRFNMWLADIIEHIVAQSLRVGVANVLADELSRQSLIEGIKAHLSNNYPNVTASVEQTEEGVRIRIEADKTHPNVPASFEAPSAAV